MKSTDTAMEKTPELSCDDVNRIYSFFSESMDPDIVYLPSWGSAAAQQSRGGGAVPAKVMASALSFFAGARGG